jgi:hypothetical protein
MDTSLTEAVLAALLCGDDEPAGERVQGTGNFHPCQSLPFVRTNEKGDLLCAVS